MKIPDLSNLNIKIFADGADLASITTMSKNPLIKGFTTNPTLMKKAGVNDYEKFARNVLEIVTDLPLVLKFLLMKKTKLKDRLKKYQVGVRM